MKFRMGSIGGSLTTMSELYKEGIMQRRKDYILLVCSTHSAGRYNEAGNDELRIDVICNISYNT